MDDGSHDILGHYLDSLSGAFYIGSARGYVFVEHEGKIHFLSPRKRAEYVSIFYSEGFLEVYTIWGRGGERAVRIVADARMVSAFSEGDDLYILIKPHGAYSMISGIVGVILKGARELEDSIRSAVEASSFEKGKNETEASMELNLGQPV